MTKSSRPFIGVSALKKIPPMKELNSKKLPVLESEPGHESNSNRKIQLAIQLRRNPSPKCGVGGIRSKGWFEQ
jgi:hypothetical protein